MKILFTGGSSFTGYWFIRELARGGHEVVATFRGDRDAYAGVRGERVAALLSICRPVFACSFGSERFCRAITEGGPCDLFCQHAAQVANYKCADFDVVAALHNNTRSLPAVFDALKERGCGAVLLTGSVFEPNEGAGSQGLPALSPYGVSKGLTAEVFRHCAATRHVRLGKFVITNPFGPFEEPRFTTYLARTWLAGQSATVQTPLYVRDNIHVSLLAKAYARFAEELVKVTAAENPRLCPSGYVESQGVFAQRVACAMRPRLGLPCEVELMPQTAFAEPRIRIGTDPPDVTDMGWTEQEAWDELAQYYCSRVGRL